MCDMDKGTTDAGFRNKSSFGANAILGISIAVAKARRLRNLHSTPPDSRGTSEAAITRFPFL